MHTPAQFAKDFWPSLLTLAVVLYLTLMPDPVPIDGPMLIPHLDKLVHAIMMGGLCGAVGFDLCRSHRVTPLTVKTMWIVAVGVILFSCFDEWLQNTMHVGRTSDPLDLIADTVGCIIAVFAAPAAVNAIFRNR